MRKDRPRPPCQGKGNRGPDGALAALHLAEELPALLAAVDIGLLAAWVGDAGEVVPDLLNRQPALAKTYEQRSKIFGILTAVGVIGSLTALAIPILLEQTGVKDVNPIQAIG